VPDVLLDTGAWVALLDRREREHESCVSALQGMTGRLISSEAVLTETLWLLGGLQQGSRKCAEFVRRGFVTSSRWIAAASASTECAAAARFD
jgi:predicted nucleic acid-binding protein